ncbi:MULTISPECIES: HutD family protein [unclassified Veillonella]|uniref:HutD family protein n=1 Tax=unclassified Veillonella TaxID=2630086 RepID=UPI00138A2828|nr:MULTISPECIES: HutD family protein [unclassified Veillonella]KAF1683518.1 hypothetical protein VER_01835 [Veillonella sp. R32]
MEITVIARHQATTSTWSGGSTTEFFIYPPQSSYSKRDFAIRISSATVDVESSEFTLLPGYTRLITPLTNQLYLSFKETADTYHLKPYEVAYFDGAYHTFSKGKATDFNVMVQQGMKVNYSVLTSSSQLNPHEHRFIYVPNLPFVPSAKARIGNLQIQPDTLYYLSDCTETVPLFLEDAAVTVLYVEISS